MERRKQSVYILRRAGKLEVVFPSLHFDLPRLLEIHHMLQYSFCYSTGTVTTIRTWRSQHLLEASDRLYVILLRISIRVIKKFQPAPQNNLIIEHSNED